MKNIGFMVVILLFHVAIASAQQQNTKQRMTFKSITIQNGDTVVTEKNIESDDPNANLSDSISMGNGAFRFRFGPGDSDDFFKEFGGGFPTNPFLNDPLISDSLINQLFFGHLNGDSTLFSRKRNFSQPYEMDAEDRYRLSDFKVAVLPEINRISITFKCSPVVKSELSILSEKGKTIYQESLEQSEGYYVKQLDLGIFENGKYEVILLQGKNRQSTAIVLSLPDTPKK